MEYEVSGQVETNMACGPLHSEPEPGECMGWEPPHPHGTRTAQGRGRLMPLDMMPRPKMTTTIPDGPVSSGERGIGMPVHINTCVRVKAAVNYLYKHHSERACRRAQSGAP